LITSKWMTAQSEGPALRDVRPMVKSGLCINERRRRSP
jgi:hypothetical protein